MGCLAPFLDSQSILQISLPGTHDSLTYDLSTTVSEGGDDGHPVISEVLHWLPSWVVPGDWIRSQGTTQGLDISSQLNAGVRFVDFRIMFTSNDWYALHFVQTNSRAMTFLKEIKGWVEAHPTEYVVLWFSKHGNTEHTGQAQYPNVPVSTKQRFWKAVEDLFGDLLFDQKASRPNETTYGDLLQLNHRVIIYASDYVEFTGSSSFALDARTIDNSLAISSVTRQNLTNDLLIFREIASRKEKDIQSNQFYLLSLASSQGAGAIEGSAKLRFLPDVEVMKFRQECATSFGVPGFTQWCPLALMDSSQLNSYYKQRVLEGAHMEGSEFPTAIYLDAVDQSGTIRTGMNRLSWRTQPPNQPCNDFYWTECLDAKDVLCRPGHGSNGEATALATFDTDGTKRGVCVEVWKNHHQCCKLQNPERATTRYAYVDTVLFANVRRVCQSHVDDCKETMKMLEGRRALHPLQLWDDVQVSGRKVDWPVAA